MSFAGPTLFVSVLLAIGSTLSSASNVTVVPPTSGTGNGTAVGPKEVVPGPYNPISYTCHDNGFSLKTRKNHSVINRARPGEWTTTCERSVMNLDCGSDKVLRIIDVEYGRFDTHTCHSYPSFFMRCEATDAYHKVHQRCDNKQRCSVSATTSEFGDPCPGIVKYLRVKHKCEPVLPENKHARTICQNETTTISCPKGTTILVADAFYGRSDPSTCPSNDNSTVTNCKSLHALDILGARCDHNQNCTLSSKTIEFDDPCPGTSKYLQVNYQCVVDDLQYAVACEGANMVLECKNMSYINVVRAEFGRSHPFMCNAGSKRLESEGCTSTNELFIIFGKCQGKTNCTIPATNKVFGEPCPGKSKYLEVDFFCTEIMDESDSGGPPQIKMLANNMFSFASNKLNATNSKNYIAQVKMGNETSWETVMDGEEDPTIDYSQPHTLGGFHPNGDYNIRIIKKRGIVSSCLPYTHIKTRGEL